ncbi:unnamed protein product [Debaryomyces tyrocola]|nr:unnamed protein product [Debaryomyces tyrocola]
MATLDFTTKPFALVCCKVFQGIGNHVPQYHPLT